MSETWAEREAEILDELERRYVDRGYTVQRTPRLADGVEADLLAQRADETVLVEVKRTTGRRRSEDPRLDTLATHAAERGWRFTIVLVGDADQLEEVEVPRRDDVLRLLHDARALDTTSWVASIAATAVFEAAARYALTRAEHPLPRPAAPAYVQALASRGMVSPEEERVLRLLIQKRNAAAHGFSARPVPDDVVTQALNIAHMLLTPAPAAA